MAKTKKKLACALAIGMLFISFSGCQNSKDKIQRIPYNAKDRYYKNYYHPYGNNAQDTYDIDE